MVPLMTVARLSATGSRPGSGRNCPDCHDWIRSPCFSCGQCGSVLVGPATLACAADCRAFIRRGGSRRSPLPHVSVPSRTRDGHRWRLRQRLEQRKRAVNLSITHKFQTSKTQKNQSDINERIYLWRPTTPPHGNQRWRGLGSLPSGGLCDGAEVESVPRIAHQPFRKKSIGKGTFKAPQPRGKPALRSSRQRSESWSFPWPKTGHWRRSMFEGPRCSGPYS